MVCSGSGLLSSMSDMFLMCRVWFLDQVSVSAKNRSRKVFFGYDESFLSQNRSCSEAMLNGISKEGLYFH